MAHTLALGALRVSGWLPRFSPEATTTPIPLAGLAFRNRVGLAAGFDKNAVAVEGLARLGFGFLEIGTVTPRPQRGNSRPRVFRVPQLGGLINRLGFPNDGAEVIAARLRRLRHTAILGVNIGKNAVTPNERAVDDYIACFNAFHAVADYVAINVSSPNTDQLRDLQQPDRLQPILEALLDAREKVQRANHRPIPLFVKVSPDLEVAELNEIAGVVRALRLDGVIATNTTIRRPLAASQSVDAGGLSGRPLLPLALDTVRQLRATLPEAIIIGCGGTQSVEDAIEMRDAGADLVQLYTGLVYRGVRLIKQLSAALNAKSTHREATA
jgi:dihydroorotate dehydrogenase